MTETPLHALAQLKQVLKDATEIRSACGFMWMRMAVVKDAQDAYDVAKREFADHEDAFRRLEAALPKANELAALLLTAGPQPQWTYTLESLAKHLGWGELTAEAAWKFMAERERLLRGAQNLLEVHRSDAPTAEEAIKDRIAVFTAGPQETPQGWQSIETAPKDGTQVVTWNGHSREISHWAASVNHFRWRDASFHVISPNPTHWLPLPASPQCGTPCETEGQL